MAEECSVYELEGFKNELEKLLNNYSGDELQRDSRTFCSEFCKLVEGYTCRWQVPLPQLRVLQIALCYFVQASSFFTSACDHVHYTLSSVALSVFELLLFFDQNNFHQDPLKLFSDTFQECNLALARHQNVHMLQITHVVQGGGPWANPILQAILSDSQLPQNEVDRYIGSELPVFFELRVHYLLACKRVGEAMALAKCCARHPAAGQHLFFLQVYLTWLCKTSQYEHLNKEVADLNGKDAVHIICNIESEEKDDVLLALSKAFLSQQLRRGDMYYLWDLVFVWSKLHWRVNPSKQTLLEESHQLMLSATNVKSIFPFIRVILAELGEEGLQFCVEVCANALQSCLPCDVITKSLIYKTIANLLPNDLEVCRACALLVFFLERTVEAYKMVFLLYTHPDQEYHSDASPIGNHVRFEIIQILKKGLYFDPEFWNLIALRTNCLKLMSEKVVSAALEEIMEEKWVPNYCTKESAIRFNANPSSCQQGTEVAHHAGAKKRHQKEDRNHVAAKRVKMRSVKAQSNADHAVKKKGKQSSQTVKETSSESFRRSFWQPDKTQENFAQQFGYGECRRITRLSEQKPPKRKIRKPRWLLEDSGALENNAPPKVKKHKMRSQHQKQHRPSLMKSSGSGAVKNNAKHTTSINSHLTARENETKCRKGHSIDPLRSASPTEVILELSQPDNELTGVFNEESFSRPRGHSQMLVYRPAAKPLVHPEAVKVVHRNEVILRARDANWFVQRLHCYARRPKGKGVVSNMQVSFSTITRSSVQGSPPKGPPGVLCEKPVVEMKVTFASQTPAAPKVTQSPAVVSQTPTTAKISQAPTADRVSETTPPATVSPNLNTARISQPPAADISQIPTSAKVPLSPNEAERSNVPAKDEMIPQSQDVVTTKAAPRADESLSDGDIPQTCKSLSPASENYKSPTDPSIADTSEAVVMTLSPKDADEEKEPKDSDVPNVTEELENTKVCSISESTLNEVSAKDLEHMPSNDEVKTNPTDIDAETNAQKETVPDEITGTNGKTSEAEATCVPKENDEDNACAEPLPTELVTELTPIVPNTEDVKEPIKEDSTSVQLTPVRNNTPGEVTPVQDCTSGEVTSVLTSREVTSVLENMSTAPCKIMPTSSCPSTGQDASAMSVLPGKQGEEMIPQEDTQNMAMTTPENNDTVGTPQESGYTQDIAMTSPENSDTMGTPPESGYTQDIAMTNPENSDTMGTPPESGYTQDIAMTSPENSDTMGTPPESGYTQNIAMTTPENSDPGGTPQESEESKLEYCCTICNKVFKGKRVVTHAMFHYRSDMCMFCGTLFKDDLLAMMHLSEHIDKLKKGKESPGPRNKAPESPVSETQEMCANQTSAETRTLSSPPLRRRGRPRKSVVNPELMNSPESSPPDDNRRFQSISKPADNQIFHENRWNESNPCSSKTPIHKVNGHVGRRRVSFETAKQDTLNVEETQTTKPVEEISHALSGGAEDISLSETSELLGESTTTSMQGEEESCSSSVDKMEKAKPEESPNTKAVTKQEEPAAIENTVETQEKVCCPVDGCVWNTDLSKNRVALLYHALEDHHGDLKPLELAFRVGNSRCGVCMRVLWSFQHYQDHVVRHRLTPRHPCLHQGCGARFKTGIEMRRHTRRHSPLQAPCCLPGCSKLFICLWALNLHEREHYATTPTKTKTVKRTNEALVVGEQEGCELKEATVSAPDITVDKTQSSKAVEKLRGKQAMDNLSIGRDIEASPFVTARTGLVKKRLKVKNKLKDSNGTKNLSLLSDKNASTPATTIIDRLREMLRKTTEKKHLSVHKVSTASLALTNGNMKKRLKNAQDNMKVQGPKRRGRPPGSTKLKKLLSNQKTSADLKDKPVVLKEETDQSRDQGTLALTQLPPSLNGNMRNRLKNAQDNIKVQGPKRRGRPPGSTKLKKLLSNKKTTADKDTDLKDKPVVCKEETDPSRDRGTFAPTLLPPSLLEKSQTSQVSNEMNKTGENSQQSCEKVADSSSTAELIDESKTPIKEQIQKQCVNEEKDTLDGPHKPSVKAVSRLTETPLPPASSAEETLKLTNEEIFKKSHVSKKPRVPKDKESPTAPWNSSKVKKKTEAANPPQSKKVKTGRPSKNTGLSKPSGKPAASETPVKVQPVTDDREVVEGHVGDTGKAKSMEETIDSVIGSPAPSNSSEAKKKRKATNTPEKKEVVKKRRQIKNPDLSKPSGKPAKSETPAKVQPVTEDRGEGHVADVDKETPTEETLDSTIGSPAPSNSSKVKKRLKATHGPENKKVKKVCPSKNTGLSKPSGKPGKSKTPAKVQPVTEDGQESHVGDMGKAKPVKETLDSTVGSPAPSNSTQLKKKQKATNTQENKTVKVCPSKNPGISKPSETLATVQPVPEDKGVQESHAGDMGEAIPTEVKLNSTIGSPGYSRLVNGHVVSNNEPQKDNVTTNVEAEKAKATPTATPQAYGKRPFVRLPPTAYLDERYTTMPKRRKEVSTFHHSSLQDTRWPAEQAFAVMPLQRQRCSNCFLSFSSAEQLQTHLSLKECSALFGFDSDDESNF